MEDNITLPSKGSKLELLIGSVGAIGSTAAHFFYRGLEKLTPDNTPNDVNYFVNSEYAKMGTGISLGLIIDALLSKLEQKLPTPERLKGLGTMAAVTLSYATLRHFVLDDAGENYLASVIQTYGDFWKSVAGMAMSDPGQKLTDIAGGSIMVMTTLRTLKNLIVYSNNGKSGK